MLWRSGAPNFRPSRLLASAVNAGVVVVGDSYKAAQTLTNNSTPTILTAIGAVTDINNPETTGGWTTLVSLTGGPLMVCPRYDNNTALHCIQMSADVGHGIRVQALIDGVVTADLLANPAASLVGTGKAMPAYHNVGSLLGYDPAYCATSFAIRAARTSFTATPNDYIKITAIDFLYGNRR